MAAAPMSIANSSVSPVEQLLLICARPVLSPQLRAVLRKLSSLSLNWGKVLNGARCNFIAALASKHLIETAADLLPAPVITELTRLRRQNAMRSLEIARIQRFLVEEILEKQNSRQVFIKGATLSHQYYGDMHLRQYRDIDLLLDEASVFAAGTELIQQRYVVTNPAWQRSRSQDLAAFCRYNSVLELRSPSGIQVELHRTLDNSGCVFSTHDYLSSSVLRQVDGTQLNVLPCTELFVYLCFHHSKHQWSSLHWCADLEAFWQHSEMDHSHVLKLARHLGLVSTIQESWKLRSDLEELAICGELSSGRTHSRFLADCLKALKLSTRAPGTDPVRASAELPREPDFPYSWQKSPAYRWRFQVARCHPSAVDYDAWPLPLRWHWLYYLVKPIRVAGSRWLRLWRRES